MNEMYEGHHEFHLELVPAFRQRDPEVAASAVHRHLSRNEETALLALDGRLRGDDRVSVPGQQLLRDLAEGVLGGGGARDEREGPERRQNGRRTTPAGWRSG